MGKEFKILQNLFIFIVPMVNKKVIMGTIGMIIFYDFLVEKSYFHKRNCKIISIIRYIWTLQ